MGISFSSLMRFFGWRPEPRDHISEGISETAHDPSLEPTTSVAASARKTPRFNLFAVIIGINKYTNCSALRGAVADANAVNEYLRMTLGVPKDHIHMLLDAQATRVAIIRAFRKLRDDKRIRKGDPILIFFAGHGSELRAPSAWHIDGLIQSILPSDYKTSNGSGIRPIPDRTIGALIDDIANEKGDNIIVIFDSCFAGGSTRVDEDEGYIPRTEFLDPNILVEVDDLDQDILEARHGALPEVFSAQGHRSHVLLAASGEAERAYEEEGRGLFTLALLKILKESDINDITYVEVIERIPNLKRQSPRCLGLHKERVIFDARVPKRQKVRYSVRIDSTGSLVVDAGQAHGVSHGVEFTLYDQRGMRLGTVKVDRGAEVKNLYTRIATSEAGDWRGARSVTLTRVGEVPFHLGRGWNSSPMATKTLRRMLGDGSNEPSFQFVEDPREARLEVAVENGQVIFNILDQRTKRFGLAKLPYTATLDSVGRILSAAAHYHWYLHHTNSRSATNYKVDIDFYMLKAGLDEDKKVYRVTDGPGLCRKDSVDGLNVIDFVVNPEAYYGIEIKNNTSRDLYLNAFLFNSDLSIVPYRIQSEKGNPEAPLKQNGSLTIGYGSSEEGPFRYWLAEDQDVDVGYLKLFFATRPIDLTDIRQVSPGFIGCDVPRLGAPSQVQKVGDFQDILFTKMIPIVQRRRHGS